MKYEEQIDRILQKASNLNIVLGSIVGIDTIRKIEEEKQILLPDSYVAFLSRIENGGIGPYYGMYSLEESIKQSELTQSDLKADNVYIEDTDIEEAEKRNLSEEEQENKVGEILGNFFEGSIDICEYGCGDYFRLILNGESRGNVWNYSYDDTGLYNLNVDILTFFENWLDRELDKQLNPDKSYLAEFSCLEFGRNTHYKLVDK
ncbi:MAG: SMI1/KNR4 family protein [Dysgonomonas sp.]|nr:SMI1/KNR4 family protein [Dysgonomonas sp.]